METLIALFAACGIGSVIGGVVVHLWSRPPLVRTPAIVPDPAGGPGATKDYG